MTENPRVVQMALAGGDGEITANNEPKSAVEVSRGWGSGCEEFCASAKLRQGSQWCWLCSGSLGKNRCVPFGKK